MTAEAAAFGSPWPEILQVEHASLSPGCNWESGAGQGDPPEPLRPAVLVCLMPSLFLSQGLPRWATQQQFLMLQFGFLWG